MNKNRELSRHSALLFIAVFILMELPIRIFIQPDPWLLTAEHWYFEQPLRIILELILVFILILVLAKAARTLLTIPKNHVSLLIISSVLSAVIFALLELDQLTNSFNTEFTLWLLWLGSGFAIGVGQELLYRGLLFTSLNHYFNVRIAGFVTTITFIIAPLHSVRLWEYLQGGHFTTVAIFVAIYFSVSTFFQWLRTHTNSVTIPALVHGVGNAITWVAVFA
ncbi:MAG: CPBP family intramembrane metalloprotease [Gammaproteobacteria bacterium]|nr:CPBP family intramembrane metalloprotease [Gammaproteobacteria bacterium]